tara:strand:- start:2239 stop:2466 length:228 start_codon:yes stop_codon:yes gene_type:complete
MNVPLTVKDMTHIVNLLREDLSYCGVVLDSESGEEAKKEASESSSSSRVLLQKIAHHTISQAYEPKSMERRHHLN